MAKEFKKAIPRPEDFEPEKYFTSGKRDGKLRCQAWSKQAGRQCRLNPVPGRDKCRFHGGLTPTGKDSSNYKHGKRTRYSIAISQQARLSRYYQEALSDDGILSLVPEIALTEAQLNELYEDRSAFSNDLLVKIRDLNRAFADLARARDDGHETGVDRSIAKLALYLDALTTLVEDGKAADDREHVLMERKRKLTETEFKRIQADDQTILLTHAMAALAAFSAAVLDIIREKTPPESAHRIIADIKATTQRFIGPVGHG